MCVHVYSGCLEGLAPSFPRHIINLVSNGSDLMTVFRANWMQYAFSSNIQAIYIMFVAQTFISSCSSCLVKENSQGITHGCKDECGCLHLQLISWARIIPCSAGQAIRFLSPYNYILVFSCRKLVPRLGGLGFFAFSKWDDNGKNSKQWNLDPAKLSNKIFAKFSGAQMSLLLTP